MQRDEAAEQGAAKPGTHAGANHLPAPPYTASDYYANEYANEYANPGNF
jgi:hypothetical protein